MASGSCRRNNLCGRLLKFSLFTAGCSCLYLLRYMPRNLGELSDQLQAEFDLPMPSLTAKRRRTNHHNTINNNTLSGRRSVFRRWNEWNQFPSNGDSTTTRSCQTFRVLFDQAPRHGCLVANHLSIPFCRMEHVRINVDYIESPAGGEELSTVMGRQEDVEYPTYHPGSWTVTKPLRGLPALLERPTFHYLRQVLSAVTVDTQKSASCVETWPGATLFLTRYEYVNLYHTMTDFFNAFLSYPNDDDNNDNNKDNDAAASGEPVNIVFLDAHAKGKLDSVWQQVFGNVTFVKQLPAGGVCFPRAVFIPPGYVSPLYPKTGRSVCPNPIMMEDFANHFLASYHLEDVQMQPGKIVIIDRVPYISHPRSKPQRAERVVHNLKHLPAHLEQLPHVESVSVVHFEELPFHEQLRVVREAHILIGNHGAGLTHMVFMSDGSHVVEFDGHLPFFTTLSPWKPQVGHHVIRSVSGQMSEDYINGVLIPTIKRILR